MQECNICKDDHHYHEIIDCITCALDARDTYTAGHSQRVSDMAQKICELIGLKEEDAEKIHIAAHLHDIGKIGVPDSVLKKEGRLTDEEFAEMKKHPAICDSIDAMTSNRCYRKAFDFDYCYGEIEKNLGKMYDPIIGRYVLDNWEDIISVVR